MTSLTLEMTRSGKSDARDDKVRFDFRFIPDAEIATWFAAADVVLAPYRIEAQSGVALTAFHFARPVIATTVGGLPEIIQEGENGYLVPPDDPDALARAIDRFFARGDRRIDGARGRGGGLEVLVGGIRTSVYALGDGE